MAIYPSLGLVHHKELYTCNNYMSCPLRKPYLGPDKMHILDKSAKIFFGRKYCFPSEELMSISCFFFIPSRSSVYAGEVLRI